MPDKCEICGELFEDRGGKDWVCRSNETWVCTADQMPYDDESEVYALAVAEVVRRHG